MAVQTVLGEIDAGRMGVTLMHEHVWIDRYPVSGDFDRRLMDQQLVVNELRALTDVGGRTVVDVTPPGIGRDPAALQRISRETGLNIVMGSGWYLEAFHPREIRDSPVSALADALVREIDEGVGATGVKPGIIGEIASGLSMSPAEERTLRAAARAQRETELPLTTHAFGSAVALHQLEVLAEERANLSRCVIGHLDSVPDPELHAAVVRSGAWAQFDLLRCRNDWEVQQAADLIAGMFRNGSEHRLLLSQDVCMKSHLRAYGGTGYTAIFDRLVPALRERGIGDGELELLLVENPRRVFT